MGESLIIRKGGGGADCTPYINELAISQGLLAYSNLILSADHANDLDNGKSFGFDNDNTVQYKALKGTYSESVIVNPSATDTILVLNTTVGLNINDEYTLQDGSLKEDVIIQSIDSGTVVTLTAPLVNSYTSAYLYDYYVGNPVGVVDYDFRADVGANGTEEKEYAFDGITSKAITSGENNVTANTIYIDFDLNENTLNNPLFDFDGVNSNQIRFNGGNLEVIGTTTGTQVQAHNSYATGAYKMVVRWTGSQYDIIIDGVVQTITGRFGSAGFPFTFDELKLAVKFTEFGEIDIRKAILRSTTVTEQQALDITSGAVELDTVLTEANSEIYYDANQDTNISTIENLGTDAGYDLTSTDVVLEVTGFIAPFTPMDLITQSYTLTNASGATLQHFAKFGTGAYNLMAETSTDNFAYEHSTEEDNIKIKTTVVGDTSQLLDIQLELGGVSAI